MSNGAKAAYPHGGFREEGLTKRELFAAMAMQGILANLAGSMGRLEEEVVALAAIQHAAALLEELEKSP